MAKGLAARITTSIGAFALLWTASCATTSSPSEEVPIAKPAPAEIAEESDQPTFYAIGTVPIKWANDEPVYRSISVFKQPANLDQLLATLTAESERREARVTKISPAGETPQLFNYIVKEGDTLQSIGEAHNVPIAEIKEINNLKSDEIHAGDSLRLPRID